MRLFTFLSFIGLSTFVYSQDQLFEVDVNAEFPGGREAMVKYIQDNIVIPQKAQRRRFKEKCYVKFVVSETGNVSNVVLQKGIEKCPECGVEAVRVVKNMPDWTPASSDGKAVNIWYTLPISFQ